MFTENKHKKADALRDKILTLKGKIQGLKDTSHISYGSTRPSVITINKPKYPFEPNLVLKITAMIMHEYKTLLKQKEKEYQAIT